MKHFRNLKAGGGAERLEKEGLYECLQLNHAVVQQEPTHHSKAIILQLKIKFCFT